MRGALSLATKRVVDVMVPIDDVFTLPATARLDAPTMTDLLERGHSRVPIHMGPDKSSCEAFLLVKDCLLLNAADAHEVASLRMHPPIWVGPADSLFELLNSFQQGHAHSARPLRTGAAGPSARRMPVAACGRVCL